MKEIVLLCQYGASTGLLAESMLLEAKKENLEANVNAYSEYDIEEVLQDKKPDVILMGPQIRFKKKEFEERYASYGIDFVLIDPMDYGTRNGKNVLKLALEHCK